MKDTLSSLRLSGLTQSLPSPLTEQQGQRLIQQLIQQTPQQLIQQTTRQNTTPLSNPRCSLIERMPKWMICIPLAVQWLWLSLRYLSPTLPSAVNPAIPTGGLVGEGKLDYFNGAGLHAKSAIADYCAVSTHRHPTRRSLTRKIATANLQFPLIAKPNLGLCGYGVQRIETMDALLAYCAVFPRNETIVLQRYLSATGEAGIFYLRDPDTDVSELIGLALRHSPHITGDGVHTIDELVQADGRARRLLQSIHHHVDVDRTQIPARGVSVRLATIGSTRVGGLYRNGAHLITPQLLAAIDAIARDMPSFFCGRFDVRFDDLDALREGHGFTIIEINGAGSEAIEAWDPDIGVINAFRMIFEKQRRLFALGHQMRRRGVRPIGLLALRRHYQRQQKLIALYPPSN